MTSSVGGGSRRPKVRLGPTGRRVAARLRDVRGDTTLQAVSERLTDLGHPISPDGLSKIELEQRRVDVDDLVALALALNVSPLTLLLPTVGGQDVALTPEKSTDAGTAWEWARVTGLLDRGYGDVGLDFYEFQRLALPLWVRRYSKDRDGLLARIRDDPETAAEMFERLDNLPDD